MFSIQLLILFISFIFCKFEINIKDINLEDNEMILLSENKSYFHFIPKSALNRCIKIIVEEVLKKEDDYINHIISYYKDSEFKEREQMAQSVSDTTFMWLNEKQIEKDFYLSIECAKTPCNSTIHIIPENSYPTLYLGQQYTYYITKDNEDLTFLIDIDLQNKTIVAVNNTFLIYARGSKYLNTKVNESEPDYQKEGYHIFLRKIEEVKEFRFYEFNIKSKPGSLIIIGVLLYGGEMDDTLDNAILENGIEYTGILYKNVIEKNCFKLPKNKNFTINYIPYDTYSYGPPEIKEENDNYNLQCYSLYIGIENLIEFDVIFYGIQFIFNLTDDGQGMNKHPKILPNILYHRDIYEGDILALNQLEPEDNYKYLSFFAFSETKIKLLSYICDSYPLCPINSEAIKKAKSIHKIFMSYSYSITKEEIGKNISPISKRQNIFLIKCEKGSRIIRQEKEFCRIELFSYNNNTKIPSDIFLIYSRKNDENHIYPFQYNRIKPEIFGERFYAIKVYSGDISFNNFNNNYTYLDYQNTKIIKVKLINDFNITIKANSDSIYSIEEYRQNYYYIFDSNYYFFNANNHLFKFEQKNDIIVTPIDFMEYIAFKPINCNITVEKMEEYIIDENKKTNFTNLPKRYGFFQDIIKIAEFEDILKELFYTIKTKDNDIKNCLFYISFFNLRNETNDHGEGILLSYNISFPFIFEQEYIEPVLFLYPFGKNYSDFSVNLKVSKNNKYNINLFINNIKIKNNIQIDSNKKILIQSKDWENICNDFKQICLLSFLLSSENKNESKIDIIISSSDYKQDEEEESEDEGISAGLIVIIVIAGLIILIGIIFMILKCRIKNSNENVEKLNMDREFESKVPLM